MIVESPEQLVKRVQKQHAEELAKLTAAPHRRFKSTTRALKATLSITPPPGLTWTGSMLGANYSEQFDGSGRENYDLTPDNRSMTAQRVFICAYTDRYTIINGFAYDEHPTILGAYCVKFTSEGWGTTTNTDYKWAKLTLGYNNLPFNPTNYKEVNFKASAEVASMDKNGCEFETGDTTVERQVNESPQIILPTIDCDIILHNQPNFASQGAADALLGKINVAAFSPNATNTWGDHQVLYKGYDSSEKFFIGGLQTFEISHHFTYCFHDWRDKYNPATGLFDKVIAKVGGAFLYSDGDFSTLGIPS